MFENFFFVALPYIAILMFFGGTLYRAFRGHWVWSARGDFSWTTRSTGFFGRSSIGAAALPLHWGIFILFVTHIVGFVGGSYGFTGWVEFFRWGGLIGGLLFLFGLLWAFCRRIFIPQLRAMSNADDYIVILLLLIIAGIGLYQAAIRQIFDVSYVAGPWIASILKLQPDASFIAGAPLLNKLHIIFSLIFFTYFPFSKMVHVVSFPLSFLFRPFISVRTYWALKK